MEEKRGWAGLGVMVMVLVDVDSKLNHCIWGGANSGAVMGRGWAGVCCSSHGRDRGRVRWDRVRWAGVRREEGESGFANDILSQTSIAASREESVAGDVHPEESLTHRSQTSAACKSLNVICLISVSSSSSPWQAWSTRNCAWS